MLCRAPTRVPAAMGTSHPEAALPSKNWLLPRYVSAHHIAAKLLGWSVIATLGNDRAARAAIHWVTAALPATHFGAVDRNTVKRTRSYAEFEPSCAE